MARNPEFPTAQGVDDIVSQEQAENKEVLDLAEFDKRSVQYLAKLHEEGVSVNIILRNMAGLDTKEAHELRQQLLKSGEQIEAENVLQGLAGCNSDTAQKLREKYAVFLNDDLLKIRGARSMTGVTDLDKRRSLFSADVGHGVNLLEMYMGSDEEEAWSLRETFIFHYDKEVLESLAGLDTERAWQMRERCLVGLSDYDSIRSSSFLYSITGLDSDRAWQARDEMKKWQPQLVLAGLAGLDSDRAWQLRDELQRTQKFNKYDMLESITGCNSDRAWQLRDEIINDKEDELRSMHLKTVARSLSGDYRTFIWRPLPRKSRPQLVDVDTIKSSVQSPSEQSQPETESVPKKPDETEVTPIIKGQEVVQTPTEFKVDTDEKIEAKVARQFGSKSVAELEEIAKQWENHTLMAEGLLEAYRSYRQNYARYLRSVLTSQGILKKEKKDSKTMLNKKELISLENILNEEYDELSEMTKSMRTSADELGLTAIIPQAYYYALSFNNLDSYRLDMGLDNLTEVVKEQANKGVFIIYPVTIEGFGGDSSEEAMKFKLDNEERYFQEFKDYLATRRKKAEIEGIDSEPTPVDERLGAKSIADAREIIKKIHFIYEARYGHGETAETAYDKFASGLEDMTVEELHNFEKELTDAGLLASVLLEKNRRYVKSYDAYFRQVMKEVRGFMKVKHSPPVVVVEAILGRFAGGRLQKIKECFAN